MKRILAVVAIIGVFSSVAFAGAVKTYCTAPGFLDTSFY